MHRALHSEKGLHDAVKAEEDALALIATSSGGDIRYALNVLELCAYGCDGVIDRACVSRYIQKAGMQIDKNGDGYYNVLSAFQKSRCV